LFVTVVKMLYRFQIELSDIDRGVYETLDFRVSQHPSETAPYLLTRVLAYALSYQKELEFSPSGLSDPDTPALKAIGKNGGIDLWVEIGNPSARKLHKAGKSAKQVVVYTYKSAEVLFNDINANDIHRKEDLIVYSLSADFLLILESRLEKNNRWSLLLQQGQLDVDAAGVSASTQFVKFLNKGK
jgi:uncharacterized protein YaeQ